MFIQMPIINILLILFIHDMAEAILDDFHFKEQNLEYVRKYAANGLALFIYQATPCLLVAALFIWAIIPPQGRVLQGSPLANLLSVLTLMFVWIIARIVRGNALHFIQQDIMEKKRQKLAEKSAESAMEQEEKNEDHQ